MIPRRVMLKRMARRRNRTWRSGWKYATVPIIIKPDDLTKEQRVQEFVDKKSAALAESLDKWRHKLDTKIFNLVANQ